MYETFITFLTFRFSTGGERDTIFTMLTVRPESALNSLTQQTRAHPAANKWTGLAQIRIPTRLVQSQISTNCFFSKIPKNPSLSLPDMTSFTSSVHFLSGVLIMTSVIVTSSPRVREHLRSMCAPTLSRKF